MDDAALARALERLRVVIRAKGLRNSTVRETVARAALTQPGHFSVEELVQVLRKGGDGDAHPATVYRVMPLLVEADLVQTATHMDGDGARYERAFEVEHHDHLVCTECGKVVEFQFEAIEVLQQDIAARFGFTLTNHVHELYGRCADCGPADRARG